MVFMNSSACIEGRAACHSEFRDRRTHVVRECGVRGRNEFVELLAFLGGGEEYVCVGEFEESLTTRR